MVDRLTDIMRAEADALDIPQPPTDAILREGRRTRRTRFVIPLLSAAAAAAAIGAFVILPGLDGQQRDPAVTVHERTAASFSSAQAAAAEHAYARSGAFAAGSKVYFGDFQKGVDIEDRAVRGLYYTSAGVLVRHGTDYVMDGSSRDGYSLVGTDGSVAGLDLSLGDVSPSTDPSQPYLAYARNGGDDWEVVILDLRTGEPAAVAPVEGVFSWGGWDAPPVALSGDRVYVGLDDVTLALDWRSGETRPTDLPVSTYPDINADRYLQVENDISGNALNVTVRVLDALTGEVLLELPEVGDRFASLSPDGKHVLVLPYLPMDEDGQVGPLEDAVLYDVDSGQSVDVPPSPEGGYGWAPGGSVISVAGNALIRCALEECSTTPIDSTTLDDGTIRLGGMVNES